MSNQPEWLDDLLSSEETEVVEYGFCVPLLKGGFAWLVPTHQDTYIQVLEDGCWCKSNDKVLRKYLMEIKSGEGNWIINPINDNSDLKWSELDYKNAAVVKRTACKNITYKYDVAEK